MKSFILAITITAVTVIAFTACNRETAPQASHSDEEKQLEPKMHSTDIQSSPDNEYELRIGSSVSGNLDYGQEIWYNVRTTEGGLLTVEAFSDIDTFLYAFDAQQNYITENDDWGGSINPRIEFMAQSDSEYFFLLKGFSSTTSGPFRITASHKPRPNLTDLHSGSHNGFIESGKEYWFRFLAGQTGVLNINTTGNIHTILEAYNRNFEFLFVNDASIDINVKAEDIYLFKLRAHDGINSGPYQITANVIPYPAPTQLSHGAFLDRYIESGDEHWYSVIVTEGDLLTVWTEGSTDTTLEAFTNDYDSIVFHDDTWYGELVNRNAQISLEIHNIAAGTVYIFRLKSFGPGPYRILVNMGYALG